MRLKYQDLLLVILMVILAFNFVDRLALGIVLEDIKTDLSLTDTQLGLLTGIAFAAFYAVMGIPIARWADRGNRVMIIALTTAFWSVGVALCGAATSFAWLLLIRAGVAVGEAGCQPAALSLIADYFARKDRSRAVGIYMLGIPLSLLVGYPLAGWLNQFYGWRATFLMLGLPGLALAALAYLALKEPRQSTPALLSREPRLQEVWQVLWRNVTYRHMLFCWSVTFFFNYGVLQWQPTFFIRSYGLTTGEVGSWFAGAYGVCGLLGTYLGGVLASRHAANNEALQLRAVAILYCSLGVIFACVYLAPNHYWAFALTGLAMMAITATNGPFLAVLQTLVPPRMRAMAVAILFFFANLIGMGLGPFAAGALSDALRPWFGEESLRYALIVLCPGFLWSMWHAWRASKTVVGDLEAVMDAGDSTPARIA
jgi:predicted MFS family arabinose efflux permease